MEELTAALVHARNEASPEPCAGIIMPLTILEGPLGSEIDRKVPGICVDTPVVAVTHSSTDIPNYLCILYMHEPDSSVVYTRVLWVWRGTAVHDT